jgi:hypothetical protein
MGISECTAQLSTDDQNEKGSIMHGYEYDGRVSDRTHSHLFDRDTGSGILHEVHGKICCMHNHKSEP